MNGKPEAIAYPDVYDLWTVRTSLTYSGAPCLHALAPARCCGTGLWTANLQKEQHGACYARTHMQCPAPLPLPSKKKSLSFQPDTEWLDVQPEGRAVQASDGLFVLGNRYIAALREFEHLYESMGWRMNTTRAWKFLWMNGPHAVFTGMEKSIARMASRWGLASMGAWAHGVRCERLSWRALAASMHMMGWLGASGAWEARRMDECKHALPVSPLDAGHGLPDHASQMSSRCCLPWVIVQGCDGEASRHCTLHELGSSSGCCITANHGLFRNALARCTGLVATFQMLSR